MIRSTCSECKQQLVDGVLEHLESCSGYKMTPTIDNYLRPPSITLTFDSPEEQAEWLRKLKGGSANIKPNESKP